MDTLLNLPTPPSNHQRRRPLGIDHLADWIGDHLDELRVAEPDMPLEDREADTWEPLIAVADLAGGDWPDRARKAAEILTRAESDQADNSIGVRLLADLQVVFKLDDRLETKSLLQALYDLEEAPWRDLSGKPLDARGLAWRLKRYGIKPTVIRFGEETARGYERASFHEAWQRYLRPERNGRNTRNSAGESVTDESVLRIDPKHENERNALTSDVTHVADVTPTTQADGLWLCQGCGEPCAFPEGWHIGCAPVEIIDELLSKYAP